MKISIIIRALSYLVGLIFLFSAFSKILNPGNFELVIVDKGILTNRYLISLIVRIIIGFEIGLGILFFQPFSLKKIIIPLTIVFLIVMTIYLVVLMILGVNDNDCGCFGNLVKMNIWQSIVKNIFLLSLTYFIFKKTERTENKPMIPFVIFPLAIIISFLIIPMKPLNTNIFEKYNKFYIYKPYKNDEYILEDLRYGERLIAIFTSTCEHCKQTAIELKELSDDHVIPPVFILLYSSDSLSTIEFYNFTRISYPYHIINDSELFELIGDSPHPPKVYLLKQGEIISSWDEDITNYIEKIF